MENLSRAGPDRSRAELALLSQNLRNIHTHRSQELSHSVVQFSGDTSSFLILNLQQTSREFGFLVSLFRSLTLRDVPRHLGHYRSLGRSSLSQAI